MKEYFTVEQGSRGATYQNGEGIFTVYKISTYGRSSVLAGQQRREWIDDFTSLESALAEYPQAVQSGCTFQPASLGHLEDADYVGEEPDYIGEAEARDIYGDE